MDIENNNFLPSPETEGADFTDLSRYEENEMIVPDDAFRAMVSEDIEITKSEEALPQSLTDEDDGFWDEDAVLFSKEELDAMHTTDAENASAAAAFDEEADNKDFFPQVLDSEMLAEKKNNETIAKPSFANSLFDVIEMFVFALAFVLFMMAFFCRHSVVEGGSMENTLYEGEHLIISDFMYTPKQGDIVVVQDASKENIDPTLAKPIVKRVIATEGQTVSIRYNGEVYVDGTLLEEKYVYIDMPDYVYKEITLTVDKGCVFLMGDHRNVSLDSRSEAGCFKEDAILGKVILRFLPLDRLGAVH